MVVRLIVEVLQGFGVAPSWSVMNHFGAAKDAKVVSDFSAQTRTTIVGVSR